MQLEVKPLKYKSLPGLSERQLAEHHDVLYAGYVKKYNEIAEKLQTVDLASANGTYSELRELMVEKAFALNGVKLHESYFDNLTDKPQSIGGRIKELIIERWGSVEAWTNEFAALGLCARGWVVLAWDYQLNRLEHYVFDAHNQGGVADTEIVLTMDVYEHAYFLDYGTVRKDYIEKFMAAIDWSVVNGRVASK
ncbi:superoxide dismutase [bacterium]|nr:superoxide dismutase [bacterium]